MNKAKNIENLLIEIVPWFDQFSRSIAVLRDAHPTREVDGARAVMLEEGRYDIILHQKFYVGNGVDIDAKTAELDAKLDELQAAHDIPLLYPAFYVPSRHHLRYIPAVEIRNEQQGLLVTIGTELRMTFDPSPIIAGNPVPAGDRTAFRFDHEAGMAKAYILVNPSQQSASFVMNDLERFVFNVVEREKQYCVHSPVKFGRDILGRGYLTTLLEMLETPKQ